MTSKFLGFTIKLVQHPYHYSIDKTVKHRLLDFGVPILLFLLFFFFYNFGKFNAHEMIKTSGLLAITLLGITLAVGPMSRLIPALDILKAHRKFWGIASFLIALIHVGLVFINYKKISLASPGILSGLLALIILFLVTMTSNQKALTKLSPQVWKAIQLTSYLALVLAVSHFYLMEQVNGVLIIKRLLGQITFVFAVLVIILRILVLALPAKKNNN